MNSVKIAIICNGKEISYGLNLLHLFQYKDKATEFYCSSFDQSSIMMYSAAAYRHATPPTPHTQVFIGNVVEIDSSYAVIYSKYGMVIYQSDSSFILKANDNQLLGQNYEAFLDYANAIRKRYCDLEIQYATRIERLDVNWIAKDFEQLSSHRLFCKKNERLQQQYDCLAFIMYLLLLKDSYIYRED